MLFVGLVLDFFVLFMGSSSDVPLVIPTLSACQADALFTAGESCTDPALMKNKMVSKTIGANLFQNGSVADSAKPFRNACEASFGFEWLRCDLPEAIERLLSGLRRSISSA